MEEDSNDDQFFDDEESDESSDSCDEDAEADTGPTWLPTRSDAGMREIPFTGDPGLKIPVPGSNSPIDWFNLLLNEEFLERIVAETNQHALNLSRGPKITNKCRIGLWKELSVTEFRKFLGLILHSGTIRLDRINDYWKTHYLFNQPTFSQFMGRDRFLLIMKCLHFSGDLRPTGEYKEKGLIVKPLVDHLNNRMMEIYYPSRELTIDEELVLWHGRLVLRRYADEKKMSLRRGMKIYSLSEPEGLQLRFHVFTGKGDPYAGKGHAENIVMKLMQDFLGRGHALYMDQFFNSFVLSSKLLRCETYSTGILQSDRKHTPEEVRLAKLIRGETVANYADGVMVGGWRGKRTVTYISTEFDNKMITTGTSSRRNQQESMPKPLLQHNAYTSVVDKLDNLMSYYPSCIKTVKWHKKIFVHFLQVVMVNSYYLYNKHNPHKLNLYEFRVDVLEELLPRRRPAQTLPPRDAMHRLVKNEKRMANGSRVKRKCRVCKREGRRRETVYTCAACPDQPGLCEVRCFDEYHKT